MVLHTTLGKIKSCWNVVVAVGEGTSKEWVIVFPGKIDHSKNCYVRIMLSRLNIKPITSFKQVMMYKTNEDIMSKDYVLR